MISGGVTFLVINVVPKISLVTGKFGMWVGNQQCVSLLLVYAAFSPIVHRFTVRNVTVNNAQSGIFSVWNWGESITIRENMVTNPLNLGWTYQGVTINNCQV